MKFEEKVDTFSDLPSITISSPVYVNNFQTVTYIVVILKPRFFWLTKGSRNKNETYILSRDLCAHICYGIWLFGPPWEPDALQPNEGKNTWGVEI
jgi:hypothetical protein